MIDLLLHLVHFCASCAADASSIPTAGGVLGGAAGAAGGVGGLAGGDGNGLNYSPSDTNTSLPPEDVTSQMRRSPLDKPIETDDEGNALAGAVIGFPLAVADAALASGEPIYKAMNVIGEDILDTAKSDMQDDYLKRNFPEDKQPYENPGDYRMGKPLGNQDRTVTLPNGDVLNPDQSITGTDGVTTLPDGYTKNPDGTVSPPANTSPAFNPDGTPVGITNPGDLPQVPGP